MEGKSSSKIIVSFYGMNHQSVEYPKQIPDFLQVRESTENKEAPMPDLPSFTHKHNDLDDMLARFDADVMQIEKNFDSLKGSLAALSQGLSKEKTSTRDSGPRFHTDLDQIFADFDQEVHKVLIVPDTPKEEFTEPLAPKEDSWLHPAGISPEPSDTDIVETEEFDTIDLPPLPEEDLGPFAEPAQEELDTIARDEAETDISEFLMEEVTPLVGEVEQLSPQPHTETFIVGQDIIEDIENVEVFLPKEEVLIGTVPVVEEENASSVAESESEPEVSYEEISIDLISPQEEHNIKPIDIEPQEIFEDTIERIEQDIKPVNIESEEISLDEENSDSYFDILGKTTNELDQLEIVSSSKIEDMSVDVDYEEPSSFGKPVEDYSSSEDVALSTDELLAIPTMPEMPASDEEPTSSFEDLSTEEEVALSTDELLAIPTMPEMPASDEEPTSAFENLSTEEEVALSTDELLAIPTMPAEPAHPAELSIDLNAEAEILARFAALNSSSSSGANVSVSASPETRIATSSTGITSLSRDELTSVMSEIDILLEYLPNHKIEELAHKDFYFLYLRLLDDLGI